MTKSLKKLLAVTLCLFMVLGTVAVGGSGIIDLLTMKVSAYNNYQVVEYGNYPQSLVEDSGIIDALNVIGGDNGTWTSYNYYSGTGNASDGNMKASDYMRYRDVGYNGKKYRGVVIDHCRPVNTGDSFDDENTPQYYSGYEPGSVYWFEYEPLRWRVIDSSTGLLMCETAIDSQAYSNYVVYRKGFILYNCYGRSSLAANYGDSSIRQWLNDNFYNTAFSDSQKANMISMTVQKYSSDKVTLLSDDIVTNYDYGFRSGSDSYKSLGSTDYAKSQGCSNNGFAGSDGKCIWRLVSDYPTETTNSLCYVNADGAVGDDESFGDTSLGVVPVIKISEIKSDASFCSVGDTFEFGTYPQSAVTDSDIIAALENAGGVWVSYNYYSGSGSSYDGKMTASDYMRYKDVVYKGCKYRAVTFDSYRPFETGSRYYDNYQGRSGYSTNTVYWFKYEPLEWRVLDPDMGMVVCSNIIDSQAYSNYILCKNSEYYGDSGCSHYADSYTYSSVRQWLNDDFYNTAFSADEKTNILTTTLDNSAYSTEYSKYNSASTSDKIYLLSYSDVKNTDYGFHESTWETDEPRMVKCSDYAKIQGLYLPDYTEESKGCTDWYLRTAGMSSGDVCSVNSLGDTEFSTKTSNVMGIVPAMNLSMTKSNTAGSEITVSNGDGTHTSYSNSVKALSTEECTYTSEAAAESSSKCPVYTYTCSECGYSYEGINHTPGNEVYENIVPATSSVAGSCDAVVYCSVCGEELSRVTSEISIGFISASCDKTEMLRGQTATFTITTTTDVAWIKLNGSYTAASGDVKTLSSYYKYNSASNAAAGITVTDADGIRTWIIPVSLSYTVSDASVTETWKITYKLSGSSDWCTAMTESGDYSSQLVIYRNASAMPSAAAGYEKYTLVSADTDKTEASVGDTVTFTVRATSDVTKVRIGYNYTANGAAKTKSVTYQTTSSNVKSITDNGDGTMTWTITYKVPATAVGETSFNVQVRGESWGTAQSKTITVA